MRGARSRIVTATLILAAGCASLPASDRGLETRVAAVLERRGLGSEALLVIDNLLRHGPPPPRAAAGLALELLARPLAAAEAGEVFRRTVPASLSAFGEKATPARRAHSMRL